MSYMLAHTAWCQSAGWAPSEVLLPQEARISGKKWGGVGLVMTAPKDTFVNGYSFINNQDSKLKDMDTKHDNPLSAFLLIWPQHVRSPSGRTHPQHTDGTTSVMFPSMATDKLGHPGRCQAFLRSSDGQPREEFTHQPPHHPNSPSSQFLHLVG